MSSVADCAPLAEAPASALASLAGIIFDIDDTVTSDGRLQQEAFDAMWDARRAGLKLIAVTGRPLGWTDVIARHWPVDLAIGENGAGWAWVDGGRFLTGYFDSEERRAAQRALLDTITAAIQRALPHVSLAGDSIARRCDLAFDAFEEHHLTDKDVRRACEIIESMGASSFVSSVHIHAVPGTWDKALGATRAANEVLGVDLGTQKSRWCFIGDSGNDEAAFAFFPLSVGVANVRKHLSGMETGPKYITHRAQGLGYAELVQAVLAARAT